MRAAADAAAEAEDWPRAVTILERLAVEQEGIPGAEGAAAAIDALAARDGLTDEIESARMFAKAERLEREANWKRALGAYEALAKRYPETKAGKLAVERAEYAASKSG
jgi:hypothetical protein